MPDSPEAIWALHEAEKKKILDRLGAALRSPAHPGMIHVEHRAHLSRLQGQTAERLGTPREAHAERFAKEMAVIQEMCGV